ncbi:MAG: dCMP deaminase family protein [Candidatus Bathyarchaeota archaeon]|nr:dCMP deaminase family protein [Candidatus Bathyarchaeota archaeon]
MNSISRPSLHEHFFNRAKVVAQRSTCLRRKVGAIIVNENGVQLSSGYSGAPRNLKHCAAIGKCLRIELGIPSGQRYELCRSVHAEQNAIINAARIGTAILGGELYISSQKMNEYTNGNEKNKIYGPCIICKKEIINAGLKKVHMREIGVGDKTYNLEDIKKLLAKEEEEWRKNVE